MMKSFILAGVGGQGTVLASKLIAKAAMARGECVRTAETIGMAQRGGCVVSHVRVGPSHSPMLPLGGADAVIGFEPAEAVRALPYLKAGGTVVCATCAVKPVTASLTGSAYDGSDVLAYLRGALVRLVLLDADAVCAACGSTKVLNVALLGAAAASGALGVTQEELKAAVLDTVPEKFAQMNIQALELGARAAKE